MQKIVVKFGGSSLATAEQFRKAAAIIKSHPGRRFVVASAPGKRDDADTKVTDLLYRCYDLAAEKEDYTKVLTQIFERFSDIIAQLDLTFDLQGEMRIIAEHLQTNPQRDYMASRGEYLNARILATFLGFAFLDAEKCVKFHMDGSFDAGATNELLGMALSTYEYAVIPGFYGADAEGTVHTFSRGGSDVTGSVVARAVKADLYENWTDVCGMLSADPRIVENPHPIDMITYRELRELSYMGATVLHEDAVFPVRKAGIPINIRNTNDPEAPGTMILPSIPPSQIQRTITGIAGHKGFTSILVEKPMMNAEIGFGAKLLKILADHHISFEHTPSGIDTMSVFVETQQLQGARMSVLQQIREQLEPDFVSMEDSIALIAVVGHGMVFSKGVAASIFSAIAEAGINIRMIDQGSSELNIIIGVEEKDYEAAIRSIYKKIEKMM